MAKPSTSSATDSSTDSSTEHLSSSISIHRLNASPDTVDSVPTTTGQDPNLILLFSWTGAASRYVAKYISGYHARFPSSPIMVITTSINDLVYRTTSKKRQSLKPAINAITSTPSFSKNVLLHAFSEGGSSTAVHLAKAFRASTSRKLQISALILDSCPGTLHFTRLASTARNTVPNNPTAKVLSSLVAYSVIASYWTTAILLGVREDIADSKDLNFKTKRELDNPYFWDTTAPRAYLLSKADKLIDWRSVVAHATAAERRGTPVDVTVFEQSGHCAHIRDPENAERYWAAVGRVWDARGEGSGGAGLVGIKNVDGGVDVSVTEVWPGRRACTCSDCGPG